MNCLTINPVEDARWLRFIEGRQEAVVFHHPSWLSVLAESYGYRPMAQVIVDGDTILAGIPLVEVRSPLTGARAVSLPFCDYCPPLPDTPESLDMLVRSLEEMRRQRGWRYVELRDNVSHPDLRPTEQYLAHLLALGSDTDALFKSFKKTQIQQSIYRAVREGVRVERRTDEEAMREFIALNVITRRRHGIPPQPDAFLGLLRKRVLEPGHGFVSLGIHGGKVIAAAVFLHFNETVVYKYGASNEAALSLRPNHAVMWDAIRWSCEQGFKQFHFGRSELSNEGLLRYKRGWGTQELPLSYVRLGASGRVSVSEGMITRAVKGVVGRTPTPILKAVGKLLYRHIG
jgi:CelD/BcsL family acetyltransferase involved in cellulose biosynthesis